jgi:hypothetical protein
MQTILAKNKNAEEAILKYAGMLDSLDSMHTIKKKTNSILPKNHLSLSILSVYLSLIYAGHF